MPFAFHLLSIQYFVILLLLLLSAGLRLIETFFAFADESSTDGQIPVNDLLRFFFKFHQLKPNHVDMRKMLRMRSKQIA